jgi:phospholipid N-methyltransferase
MAKEVDYQADGIILELGGGTGVITHALLQQGVSPDKLITIERSPTLAAYLRQKFPDICVIEGDASQLDKLLDNNIGKINTVISSLPLRSLPKSSVTAIKQQINKVLDKNGLFIQFTYDLRVTPLSKSLDTHFSCKNTQLVWKNLPPARVDTFIQS